MGGWKSFPLEPAQSPSVVNLTISCGRDISQRILTGYFP
ncbi:hypothetical protein FRUB_06177 [Fimbriiglobus ruber]|uniref:Uncharacterized protein n=1 Tax=Fimbriiglobus ruber TaxID=1908690 RepID=A0A225DRT4_9BACT|nr:hypothetical protein FRUB_06177 [Fimbriiglobus ruber]